MKGSKTMEIISRSINIIDYENQIVSNRDIPETFNNFVIELIGYISENNRIREYKTSSNSTEVITCVQNILTYKDSQEIFSEKSKIIANRLLMKEVNIQEKIEKMNISVKKGSLIQSLLFNDETETYLYLLAKVEHSEFVDDMDFSFKTGFSKSKKTIWKTCLIDLPDTGLEEYNAKIYVDNKAQYWSKEFLEMIELQTDETNTLRAFTEIDKVLNRNIKNDYPGDNLIIRNAFISYFRNHDHIDFVEMVDEVLGQYVPQDMTKDVLKKVTQKIVELPENKKFDLQFNSVPQTLTARIKKVYNVYSGIQLKLLKSHDNIKEIITAHQDEDGKRYINILTDDNETFNSFK